MTIPQPIPNTARAHPSKGRQAPRARPGLWWRCAASYDRTPKPMVQFSTTSSWTTRRLKPARTSSRPGSATSTMASIWAHGWSFIPVPFPGSYPGDRWRTFVSSISVASDVSGYDQGCRSGSVLRK